MSQFYRITYLALFAVTTGLVALSVFSSSGQVRLGQRLTQLEREQHAIARLQQSKSAELAEMKALKKVTASVDGQGFVAAQHMLSLVDAHAVASR